MAAEMPTEAQPTPGPWEVGDGGEVYSPAHYQSVCMVLQCGAEGDANGRLIASAPALKAENERLRDIAGRLVEVVHELAKLGRCPIILRALAMDARAALTQERA